MGQTKFELANDIFFQCAQLNQLIIKYSDVNDNMYQNKEYAKF